MECAAQLLGLLLSAFAVNGGDRAVHAAMAEASIVNSPEQVVLQEHCF